MIENSSHSPATSGRVLVADAPDGGRIGHGSPAAASATVVHPTDRVRWGPVVAGLLSALSALAVLTVLGLAVGLSTFDGDDSARNYGIRAGVWGAVSALIAFFLGGWIAARTAAVRGKDNGLLNGAMVWALAVPLLMYMVGSGIGAAANTAGQAAQAAAQTAGAVANTPQGQEAANKAEASADQAQQKAKDAAAQVTAKANDPAVREQAQKAARNTAWGTLASMLLALGAAAVGGLMGARDDRREHHTATA